MRYFARSLIAVVASLVGAVQVANAGCPIPGFTNAAFADTSLSTNGTIDSWDSGSNGSNAYSSSTACSDTTSCTDANSCAANIGTNASSFGSTPTTSGSCTTGANVSLPIPTMPTIAAANQLGAISGNKTVTGPGSFSATSISESGNASIDFKTAGKGQVVLYLSGDMTLSGNGALNNDSALPSNVLIMCTGSSQTITLNGNGNAYFTLYCPQADIVLHGGGSGGAIWGAIVGKTISGSGSHALTLHYDKEVANMTSSAITCNVEVSRASPVVATLGSTDYVIQGTTGTTGTKTALTTTNASTWTFPAYTGHMRARSVSAITSSATAFSTGTPYFDANGKIPTSSASCSVGTGLTGSCRYIFTNTNTVGGATFHPSTVSFDDTNASTIVSKILTGLSSANQLLVLKTIRGAGLGGVDRSTVAVIGPSSIAGSSSRPTIAYFGAADGMVHAVCASIDGTICTSAHGLGTELWAFLPAVQLPLIAYNDQRIDGSVHVIDAFGDFTNNPATGTKSWHTVLVFQTGYSNTTEGGKAATYAIDVTDPSKPTLLWEYATPSSASTYDFGTGLVASLGPSLVNGTRTNLAVLETNNGGSGTSAMVATALSLETGTKVWQFSTQYPTAASVPSAALPGGAVGVDLTGNGFITDYLMGDLYGYLWRIDASAGTSKYGSTTPLFKFTYASSTDKHPIGAVPAVYSDGSNQYVAVAAGGYADQTNGNTNWSLGTHYLVAVKINSTSGGVLDTATASNNATGDLRLKLAIATSSKAYSQPTIVGNQMFVTSDIADVNASSYGANQTGSGRVLTINGINGTATSNSYDTSNSSMYAGASSLASGHDSSGNLVLINSASDKQAQVGIAAVNQAGTGAALTSSALGTGATVDTIGTTKLTRAAWLRTM